MIPGAEVTQNHIRAKHNSHIVALGIKEFISADEKARHILEEIRRQDGLSIACHPHHRTTRRMEIATCYLWDHRKELADLVDVWEAANRDDLFSVTSLKHYPYVANSDFHKAKHLYSWKTLVRSAKTWPAVKSALKSNVDIAITLYRTVFAVSARCARGRHHQPHFRAATAWERRRARRARDTHARAAGREGQSA